MCFYCISFSNAYTKMDNDRKTLLNYQYLHKYPLNARMPSLTQCDRIIDIRNKTS